MALPLFSTNNVGLWGDSLLENSERKERRFSAGWRGYELAGTGARDKLWVVTRRVKLSRRLGLAAMVVFVVSHFLPAYGSGSGFACFKECWNMFLGDNTEIFSQGWCYYSGFAIGNIIFIRLVVGLFVTRKSREFLLVVSIVCFLHVLSWSVLHIFGRTSQIAEIKIGYYVWLIAYGLLVAAYLWKEPRESLESMRLEGSAG